MPVVYPFPLPATAIAGSGPESDAAAVAGTKPDIAGPAGSADGDAYCTLLRRSRDGVARRWRGSGGDAAVVAAMLSALFTPVLYGYPMLHGHMDTVESSLHMHSLQRAFVFDVAGGVDPASNCTAAAALAGLRATVECSGSPASTGAGGNPLARMRLVLSQAGEAAGVVGGRRRR